MCETWDHPSCFSLLIQVQSRTPLTRMSTYVAVRNLLYNFLRHTCIILLPLVEPGGTRERLKVHEHTKCYLQPTGKKVTSFCFLPLKKCLSFQCLDKFQSLLFTNTRYALMEAWKCTVNTSSYMLMIWCVDVSNGLSHLRNIITAKEDGNTNKVLSAQM